MTDEPKDHTLRLLREIRAEQERLATIVGKIADAVTADVIRAYVTLKEAVGRLASLHEETTQAEENDRVTQERYRQGVALSSESLDAQTMLVRARLREDGALFDCQVARAPLQRAVGE